MNARGSHDKSADFRKRVIPTSLHRENTLILNVVLRRISDRNKTGNPCAGIASGKSPTSTFENFNPRDTRVRVVDRNADVPSEVLSFLEVFRTRRYRKSVQINVVRGICADRRLTRFVLLESRERTNFENCFST